MYKERHIIEEKQVTNLNFTNLQSIVKLQFYNCHNTNYEYCINILHISSIPMINTSMFTSIHLTLSKSIFTEQGFTNIDLPICNYKVAKLFCILGILTHLAFHMIQISIRFDRHVLLLTYIDINMDIVDL